MTTLSTTIKRKFLDQKLKELNERGFTYEYKEPTKFWTRRIVGQGFPCDFVYVCGQKVVRLCALEHSAIDTPTRNGIPEVVSTPKCWAIKLAPKEECVRRIRRLRDKLRTTFGQRVFNHDDLSSFCAGFDHADNELLSRLLVKMSDNGELELVANGCVLTYGRQTHITEFESEGETGHAD